MAAGGNSTVLPSAAKRRAPPPGGRRLPSIPAGPSAHLGPAPRLPQQQGHLALCIDEPLLSSSRSGAWSPDPSVELSEVMLSGRLLQERGSSRAPAHHLEGARASGATCRNASGLGDWRPSQDGHEVQRQEAVAGNAPETPGRAEARGRTAAVGWDAQAQWGRRRPWHSPGDWAGMGVPTGWPSLSAHHQGTGPDSSRVPRASSGRPRGWALPCHGLWTQSCGLRAGRKCRGKQGPSLQPGSGNCSPGPWISGSSLGSKNRCRVGGGGRWPPWVHGAGGRGATSHQEVCVVRQASCRLRVGGQWSGPRACCPLPSREART